MEKIGKEERMKKARITQLIRIGAFVVCCILVLYLLFYLTLGLMLAIGGSMEMHPTEEQMSKAVVGGAVIAVLAGMCLIPCIILLVVLGKKIAAAGKKIRQMKALGGETTAQSERTLS